MNLSPLKESSFKQYKSQLDDLLTRFRDLQAQIYPPFYSLFTSQLTQIYRAFEPGLHTINWSNMNIDAFIAKVHRALDQFDTFLSNINKLIAEKIERILDQELFNSSCLLFSPDFVRSKLWSPAEFVEQVSTHLREHAVLIGRTLFEVQQRFQEVEDMVRVNSPGQKSRTSTSSTRRTKTPVVSNEAMATFIRYYHDKMNACVRQIIERSLRTFIQLAAVSTENYAADQTTLTRVLLEGEPLAEQHQHVDTDRIRYVNHPSLHTLHSFPFSPQDWLHDAICHPGDQHQSRARALPEVHSRRGIRHDRLREANQWYASRVTAFSSYTFVSPDQIRLVSTTIPLVVSQRRSNPTRFSPI